MRSAAASDHSASGAPPLAGSEGPEDPFLPQPIPFTERLPQVSLVKSMLERLWMSWTPAGRAYLVATTLIGGVSAGFTLSYGMYAIAALLLALGAIDGVLGWLALPRVTIRRQTTGRCAAGALVTARARVEHTGRLPGFDLALREDLKPRVVRHPGELAYLPRLDPGQSVELSATFQPLRRGAYELPGPELLSAFPFGLYVNRKRSKQPMSLLVTPHFVPLVSLRVPAGHKHQPGGLQLTSKVGDSEEFIGNREYRPGDRLRDIHHAAWARVGKPVVREFQEEYLTRIALVVDTFVGREPLPPGRRRRLEAGISLGAAVADALSRQEYVIDLFAAGQELYHFQAGRHLAFLDDVLDVLACIDPCPKDPFPELGPAVGQSLAQISTAIVVLLDWDETRRDFVELLKDNGLETLVFVVRDKAPTLDPTGFLTAGGEVRVFSPAEVEQGLGSL